MTLLTWPLRLLWFGLWFLWDLLSSNWQVARDNLTPGQNATPGIARCVTECRSDRELTLLGALVTLTPGTLTLGATREPDGHRVLYVHALYHRDPEATRAEVRELEEHMERAVRPFISRKETR